MLSTASRAPGARLAPAALDVCVRKPGVDAVEADAEQREHRHEEPGDPAPYRQRRRSRGDRRNRGQSPCLREPEQREACGDRGEHEQRRAPGAGRRERDGGRRGERRSGVDAADVDAGGEGRPVTESLFDRDGHERARDGDADANREREQEHGRGARRESARDAGKTEQGDRQADRPVRPMLPDTYAAAGREETHAGDRDRAEQPGDGM